MVSGKDRVVSPRPPARSVVLTGPPARPPTRERTGSGKTRELRRCKDRARSVRDDAREILEEARIGYCDAFVVVQGRFTFDDEGRLAMTGAEFHDAWRLLPPEATALFHAHCLESNPQWGLSLDLVDG